MPLISLAYGLWNTMNDVESQNIVTSRNLPALADGHAMGWTKEAILHRSKRKHLASSP